MRDDTVVSVLLPARNEADNIRSCIEHLARQTFPLGNIQIVVVDGASEDGTDGIADAALAKDPPLFAKVVTNPEATTPSNLNRGLEEATGDIICRVDARSRLQPDHIELCVELLETRNDISVVGGSQRALSANGSFFSKGIARGLNNRYATGGSRYRHSRSSGPTDTVYLGAFRAADLRQVGGWDPDMHTNQDFDLNRRLSELGAVWFESRLSTGYVPRQTFRALWRQYFRFGRWKVRYWRSKQARPESRQLLILMSPALAILGFYALSRRCGLLVAFSSAAVLAAGIDTIGSSDESKECLRARTVSIATIATVTTGWTFGVWREAIHKRC